MALALKVSSQNSNYLLIIINSPSPTRLVVNIFTHQTCYKVSFETLVFVNYCLYPRNCVVDLPNLYRSQTDLNSSKNTASVFIVRILNKHKTVKLKVYSHCVGARAGQEAKVEGLE